MLGDYITRPSAAEAARRAAEQCARSLARPTWPEYAGGSSPSLYAWTAAETALSKTVCAYGAGSAQAKRLGDELRSLQRDWVPPFEAFAAC